MPKKPPASEKDRQAGLRLKAVRLAFDEHGPINQELFAKKIRRERTTLANWEAGALPDVRAMVLLYEWIGIPLEWIYLGEVRRVDFDLADRLVAAAAELGAVVGGAAAEWPMAVERRAGLAAMRPPARVPARTPRRRQLHERPVDK